MVLVPVFGFGFDFDFDFDSGCAGVVAVEVPWASMVLVLDAPGALVVLAGLVVLLAVLEPPQPAIASAATSAPES